MLMRGRAVIQGDTSAVVQGDARALTRTPSVHLHVRLLAGDDAPCSFVRFFFHFVSFLVSFFTSFRSPISFPVSSFLRASPLLFACRSPAPFRGSTISFPTSFRVLLFPISFRVRSPFRVRSLPISFSFSCSAPLPVSPFVECLSSVCWLRGSAVACAIVQQG